MRFSHTIFLYFRVFNFPHHRKHTLDFTKKNFLFLSVAVNTLYSENHVVLNADCAMTQAVGRRPSHREGPDSIPGQSIGDLCWADCHWDRFYSEFGDFPCQYLSTNGPYPSINLPPTLYNVSLPVLQFSPVSIIPPTLHTHSFTYNPRYIMFLSQHFSFPLSVFFHQCSIPIHSPTTHAI